MSFATTYSRANLGLEAPLVRIETHLSNGLPKFSIVGLPEKAVKESRDRVRSALLSCGFTFPRKHITVNLAPADLPKLGCRFDLPIALGILAASHQIPPNALHEFEFAGELGLAGELRPIQGALCFALGSDRSRTFILPEANAEEVSLVKEQLFLPAKDLLSVCAHLCKQRSLSPYVPNPLSPPMSTSIDLQEVQGQSQAIRALTLAAAGGHHLLMVGPPGIGKTLLARRLPTILPPLSEHHQLETLAIHYLQQTFSMPTLSSLPPFREPHHSASLPALVGGGNPPQPGEISLAHHGVLFLDELPEFQRSVLESLREPLESGHITIARSGAHVRFAAEFQLVAAMNPCPCGYAGDPKVDCSCSPTQKIRYQQRISGPLLDRFDLHVRLQRPTLSLFTSSSHSPTLTSQEARSHVQATRTRQLTRQGKLNVRLSTPEIEQYCPLDLHQKSFLQKLQQASTLSLRSFYRIRSLARTIADYEGANVVELSHLTEAFSYRPYWMSHSLSPDLKQETGGGIRAQSI